MVWSDPISRFLKKREPSTNASPLPPESETNWEEKRTERRVELEVLMTATTRDGKTYRAYSRDLSHAGSAAIVWGELALGEKVSLAYRFPQLTEEIVVPAVVRHAIEHRYGMEFVSNDREQLQSEIARVFNAAASLGHPAAAN
jgi:hypothetical protein